MTIYKNKDISVDIKAVDVNVGYVGAKFYTEDDFTGAITVHIKYNGNQPFNFNLTDMKPILYLFAKDGTKIISDMEIVDISNGITRYYVGQDILEHIGRVNAKMFLHSETESVHVINFQFDIGDSNVF